MENQEQPLLVSFIAGSQGDWRIERIDAVTGESLPSADRLEVVESPSVSSSVHPAWVLRGVTSNVRYTNRAEVDALNEKQEGLHRPQATRAALIPIRKSAAWWKLAQDERRRILEEDSHHIAVGLEYLPAIARRLHHSRDLSEPFDFLTWFEYAPEHSGAFEELVQRLRHTREWDYVDREVDIRLVRS
jgi:chlorite dismutase